MTLPYENATSGKKSVDEIGKILREFGASSFGLMEDFDKGELVAQFVFRDVPVTIRASSKGYAATWLRKNPWTHRHKSTRVEYERKAIAQANIAVYSILRDWIKGQVTAVEVGMLTFEGAFLGQIMLANGETVLDRVKTQKLLPKSEAA